ncbi:ParB N-terminal domain-containing protein [Vibrio europaeus]|uniref:ParB N-terminal domain-containing protein n=1 Tax=Vibrio europaeus TaxID=300876 RepID=UPI00148BA96B|nr:ParB N-terminal domain-containing protein [Vibrio europaeus]MDC5822033.1 ParB N-terminal domain-containing protein [Vibrio europaeus]MDC5837986.1 ParB N-terminal domain-containing protein [Vibrio europaeus]MDC5855118.1 ParB N-terminal domain-containing protein [Vibrio europaeus]MDC5870121.1 ParB N-terminal domain-containing protein [Vibrio europaeus]NOH22762.1 hypothetical protein [Vibrio europaeus]
MSRFELMSPNELIPIEDFSRERVEWLKSKVTEENEWSVPICVSSEGFVMDGHHRHQTALALGLSNVPVERFSYCEVGLYSLRDDVDVSYEIIKSNIASGVIFPYKTAKHDFPSARENFEPVPLEKLK